MNLDIQVAIRDFDVAYNKSLDWLILSWEQKDKYDRKICFIKYLKYKEKRNEANDRLIMYFSN